MLVTLDKLEFLQIFPLLGSGNLATPSHSHVGSESSESSNGEYGILDELVHLILGSPGTQGLLYPPFPPSCFFVSQCAEHERYERQRKFSN